MKKLPLFLFIAALALLVYAMFYLKDGNVKIKTGKSSKVEAKKEEKTEKVQKSKKSEGSGEFDKIEVDGIFEVVVTYGNKEKIEVVAHDNTRKEINMKVKSGTLLVKFDKSTARLYNKGSKIHVYTAKLNDFLLEGGASVKLNNTLKGDYFSIKSSGAAFFKGDIDVTDADIELNGASKIELSGTATTANLNLSGTGKLKDFDFKVNNLSVNMNGLSNANISCLKSIEGDLSGISKLTYEGKPSVKNVKTSGSASLQER